MKWIVQMNFLAREVTHNLVSHTFYIKKSDNFGIIIDDKRDIIFIDPQSNAFYSGLRIKDKILCINGSYVDSVDLLKKYCYSSNKGLYFSISRSPKFFYTAVFV